QVLDAFFVPLDQMVSHGNAEHLGEFRGATDRQDRAARLEELSQLGDSRGRRDVAAAAAVFGGNVLLGARGRCGIDRWYVTARIRAGRTTTAATSAAPTAADHPVHEDERVELL